MLLKYAIGGQRRCVQLRTGLMNSAISIISMKRSATTSSEGRNKRQRKSSTIPDYCDVDMRHDKDGRSLWPASTSSMEKAQEFLRECAASQSKTLIVPDKDADGLSSGAIIHRTLSALGLAKDRIQVHLLKKHANVHDDAERQAMAEKEPRYIIMLDQGSRRAPSLQPAAGVRTLLIDHHLSDEFPEDTTVVSACHYPPVATSALLTYEICKVLHPSLEQSCALYCAIGTHGDLGNTLKWKPPFPDMKSMFKEHTKKKVNEAVGFINAPRRTAEYDVMSAWNALLEAQTPDSILKHAGLRRARKDINAAVEQHTHAPPKFSRDGRFAVLRVNSGAQIHGVIATRWAGHLQSKSLEIVLVANSGYRPGFVNFSCRTARCARQADRPKVNIIQALEDAAALDSSGELRTRLGENFARGHKEASGGIISADDFEELMRLLGVGEKPQTSPSKGIKASEKLISPQKNTLMKYFEPQKA